MTDRDSQNDSPETANLSAARSRGTVRKKLRISLADSQISGDTVWNSGSIDISGVGVSKGSDLLLEVSFKDGDVLVLEDTGIFNSNEGLFFEIRGGTPQQGSNRDADWEWSFSVDSGSVEEDPFTGTGIVHSRTGNCRINEDNDTESVDIVGSKAAFDGFDLRVTMPSDLPAGFTPKSVVFRIEGDKVSID